MTNLCKILLVDDEYLLRQGLKYLCNWESYGFSIIGEASNGEEAISLVKLHKPHIVITDIVMPLIDGIELIKLIKAFDESIQIIVLSSYGDFDYVKPSFKYGVQDYILKPKLQQDELLPILQKLKQNIISAREIPQKNSLDSQLHLEISSILNDFNTSEISFKNIENFFKEDTFIFLSTNLSSLCQNQNVFEKLKTEAILPLVESHLQGYTYLHFSVAPYDYTLLINLPSDQDSMLHTKLIALVNELALTLTPIHFAVSDFFTSLQALKTYYTQCNTLLNYTFYFENEKLLTPQMIAGPKNTIAFDFTTYYQYLECLDSTKVKDCISDYIKSVAMHLDCDAFLLKKSIENIIYSTIHFMEKLGFDITSLNMLKITSLKEIEDAPYISALLSLVLSLINEIFIEIASQSDRAHFFIVDKVTTYIKENYHQQISLATVAESLHLNYYYLSTVFNNHAKESFTDYVNKIRIQKAKELLQNSHLSIAEVSEAIGYTDQSYFGKVFKKFTGTTPSTYRKKFIFLG